MLPLNSRFGIFLEQFPILAHHLDGDFPCKAFWGLLSPGRWRGVAAYEASHDGQNC